VLERELHDIRLASTGRRRVRGSVAGGDHGGRGRGRGGGAGADALKLVVVVEDQLVGMEGGREGEREDGGEESEEEETAARRGHGSAGGGRQKLGVDLARNVRQIREIFLTMGIGYLGLG
jgi:hypothetical protein